MFEGSSKCKFDLSNSLKQLFNVFKKSQVRNTAIVRELFKEDCIILVLKLFELYFIFGFGYCHNFCKGNMPTLVVTC